MRDICGGLVGIFFGWWCCFLACIMSMVFVVTSRCQDVVWCGGVEGVVCGGGVVWGKVGGMVWWCGGGWGKGEEAEMKDRLR